MVEVSRLTVLKLRYKMCFRLMIESDCVFVSTLSWCGKLLKSSKELQTYYE